jgi:hypothetical protein
VTATTSDVVAPEDSSGFSVRVGDFEGPFDLLLQLSGSTQLPLQFRRLCLKLHDLLPLLKELLASERHANLYGLSISKLGDA